MVDDAELLELVELEIRELLTKYASLVTMFPIVKGNALAAYNSPADPVASKCISDLLDAVDSYIPQPAREEDKPFLMAIEDESASKVVVPLRPVVLTWRDQGG